MNKRDDLAHKAATMYYLQDQTMDFVAKEFEVSRATVSRLLKHARDTGLVRITLGDPPGHGDELGSRLEKHFEINAHVVPVRGSSSPIHQMEQVSRVAASELDRLMEPGTTLGVAWGSTVTELSRHLVPRKVRDSVVVQLNGAGNARRSGIPYTGAILSSVAEAFGSQIVHFPVPAFFDYADTKQAMWRERSIRGVLALQAQADVALFGVGAINGPLPSHVYSSGYLDEADFAVLAREGVVGDICTVLMREDGTWQDIEMNRRATGPTPMELSRINRRLCVVSGPHRAAALLGALRARAVTDLVVDALTAKILLDKITGARG
ncbi:sugar-binding transcriptional regulator [Curtobacterium sp. S6]|uniref:sugar-binding transcriptional regulator n=1 Tax=Curtobacterium sp. S6 TaxID=1479623 RepID=UPI0004AA85AF|nr:sugar-binding domain-containing protein [Curtobacterium sp. S6]